jgi:hypothetical protein
MHVELGRLSEDDPIRKLAAGHARYALGVRPNLLSRLFYRGRD